MLTHGSRILRLSVGICLLGAGACSLAPGPTDGPGPTTVPQLTDLLGDGLTNMEDVGLLAGAYLAMGRAAEADSLVAWAREILPTHPEGALYQALAHEAQGHVDEARALYAAYLKGDGAFFPGEAQGRLDRLDFEALAREGQEPLAAQGARNSVPDSTFVVVLPITTTPGGARVPALAAAMSELIAADLEATRWLKVAPRPRARGLAALVPGANAVTNDPDAAEAVGRALGAGIVVQGRMSDLDGFAARLEINVLVLGPEGLRSVVPGVFEGRWSQLATIQRQVTPFLYQTLGVGWTTGARDNFRRSSRSSFEAVEVFGQGLLAQDMGDYETAEALFEESNKLDNRFWLAHVHAERARYLRAGAESPGPVAWRMAQEAVQRRHVMALRADPSGADRSLRGSLGNRRRSVTAEILGLDGIGVGSIIELVFISGGGVRE